MSKTIRTELGDYILRIAPRESFRDFHAIWDHPQNKALHDERFNPNVLDVGDSLFIPDVEPLRDTRPTNQVNVFTVSDGRTILTLTFETAGFQPRAGRKTKAIVTTISPDGKLTTSEPPGGTTFPDGHETMRSRNPLVTVTLILEETETEPEDRFELLVGQLAPLKTRHGQQARLNNLGYLAGFRPDNLEQFRWAVEEFQADHKKQFPKMKAGIAKDGTVDRETLIALGTVHGDLLPGQERTL